MAVVSLLSRCSRGKSTTRTEKLKCVMKRIFLDQMAASEAARERASPEVFGWEMSSVCVCLGLMAKRTKAHDI